MRRTVLVFLVPVPADLYSAPRGKTASDSPWSETCAYDGRMGDVDDLAALRETMARLIEEAHQLRAVTDKLREEGRRLRHDLRHLMERDQVADTMRRAA
jgi:hypothetical protein